MFKQSNIINRYYRKMQLQRLPVIHCASHLILFFYLFIPAIAYTQEESVLIVTSSKNVFSTRLIDSLSSELKQKNITTKIKIIDQYNKLSITESKQHKLIIALGSLTNKYIFEQNITTPVLSLLIPSQSLDSLKFLKNKKPPWTVVFLDQPLQRQIIFSRYLLGTNKNIGFLLGPYSGKQLPLITDTASRLNANIYVEHIDNDDMLIPSIRNLINNSDMILSLPDPVAFNRKTIRGILLISYRNNIPVIGFSKAYVKSGALAAIYSTAEQISQQASEITVKFIDTNKFKQELNYPRYYSIATNAQVARALGINMKSDNELLELTKDFERAK